MRPAEHLHKPIRRHARKPFAGHVVRGDRVEPFAADREDFDQAEAADFFAFLQAPGFFDAAQHGAGLQRPPAESPGHGLGAVAELRCGHRKRDVAGHWIER